MKTIITSTLILAAILYVAGLSINFKPFKISFETPYTAIGLIFFSIALGFWNYQSKLEGRKEGRKEIMTLLEEISKEREAK